ncbi:MAG: aspartate ammonia-lyase [Candidatus Aureabacteria bacterium]|nr:aspartate ammonia-lyase [Candidatus Auribacterota bacterium]
MNKHESKPAPYRIEKDILGEVNIPVDAYWGIHTLRARQNFPFSCPKVSEDLIRAYAQVKMACARANHELGFLNPETASAIETACQDLIAGKFADQFILSSLQGGAGTSLNMNVNEVIANRGLELLGYEKGRHPQALDPLLHVNLHQSTNDTYPTALKIAVIMKLKKLSSAIAALQGSLQLKEKEFAGIIIMGKTEMQDAVPITLGSQFASFAEPIGRDRWRTFKAEERIRTVNIGGTAVGTGLAAPRNYIFLVIEKLREITGLGISRSEHLMGETANTDSFVEVSGMLSAHSANLVKVCNDLRMLHYLGEIQLPPVQAGSSIMPGKINPVILEACISSAMKAENNDSLIKRASSSGTFQINEFIPLIALALLESLDILTTSDEILSEHVKQITRTGNNQSNHEDNPAIITAFLPYIGYHRAEELVMEFRGSGHPHILFLQFLSDKLGREIIQKALSPEQLMALGYKR